MTTRGRFINTYTGNRFYPMNPSVDEVHIIDIAHALSNIARFTGHTNEFYSVAQHSVLVSELCEPRHALWGLLHDGSEAYISDVASPVKRSPEMAFYKVAEKKVQDVICQRFDLPKDMPPDVHLADATAFITEARDLMSVPMSEWGTGWPDPLEDFIVPLPPKAAKTLFLNRYFELMSLE